MSGVARYAIAIQLNQHMLVERGDDCGKVDTKKRFKLSVCYVTGRDQQESRRFVLQEERVDKIGIFRDQNPPLVSAEISQNAIGGPVV